MLEQMILEKNNIMYNKYQQSTQDHKEDVQVCVQRGRQLHWHKNAVDYDQTGNVFFGFQHKQTVVFKALLVCKQMFRIPTKKGTVIHFQRKHKNYRA